MLCQSVLLYTANYEIFHGQHEDASVTMFDHMLKDRGLKGAFRKYGLDVKKDGAFIKDLIKGTPREGDNKYEEVGIISYEDLSLLVGFPRV